MFGEGTKLYSILRMKCPRCHEGDFFKVIFIITQRFCKSLVANCEIQISQVTTKFYAGYNVHIY